MEAGEPITPWGRRSCRSVISLGHPCQCSGMAGSLPVVWIRMVFRSWEISTPRVFRKCGMERCYLGSEITLESSTTVTIQFVSPAIGYAGVKGEAGFSRGARVLSWESGDRRIDSATLRRPATSWLPTRISFCTLKPEWRQPSNVLIGFSSMRPSRCSIVRSRNTQRAEQSGARRCTTSRISRRVLA